MSEKNNIPQIRFKEFEGKWKSAEMNKVAEFSKGHSYSKKDLVKEGKPIILYGRLYTNYESTISDVDTFAIEKPGSKYSNGSEVIVPASGETAEDIAIASVVLKPDIILGGDLNIIYPNELIDSVFLALTISHGKQHKELSKKAQGKSIVHLRNSDIKETTLFYTGKDEQSKIGTYFQNLDKLITLQQQKHDKLVTLKKAMLDKMFPKEGADVPEIRFKGFTCEWKEVRLGDLGVFKSNGVDKKSNTNEIPVYLLNYMDVYNRKKINALNYHTLMPVTARSSQLVDNNIQKNDVFFTPSSETSDDIGKVMVIEESLPHTVYSYHLVRYRPKENCFAPLFPNYGFSCDFVRKQMILAAQGVQRFVINRNGFEELRVMLPLIEEQSQISSYFQNLDKLISLHQQEIQKLKNIKKACLEKMFV